MCPNYATCLIFKEIRVLDLASKKSYWLKFKLCQPVQHVYWQLIRNALVQATCLLIFHLKHHSILCLL
jgi:hypothetical protein